jgi:hypothetical protein
VARKWVILLAGGVVAIGVLALIFVPDRAPIGNAAAVSGTFLHYTNDASGARLAVFKISNQSRLPIRREHYYEVHVRHRSGWTNFPTVFLPRFAMGPVVRPNKSEVFTIKDPSATSRWRLCYPYVEHESWIRRVRAALGLPSKRVVSSYAGFSNEIDP